MKNEEMLRERNTGLAEGDEECVEGEEEKKVAGGRRGGGGAMFKKAA